MKKRLWILLVVLIVAIPLMLLPIGQAFADEATDNSETTTTDETTDQTSEEETPDTTETADEPILTEEELTALQEILAKLQNAQTTDEITDIIQETIFTRIGAWFGENSTLVTNIIYVALSIVITILFKKNGKFSLGLLNNNKAVVTAVNANTVSNQEMTENNKTILHNSTETAKAAKIAQITADATLKMMSLLIEKSNLTVAAKDCATNIYNIANAEINKTINE
ncbi:MAG: hypothetical protein AB7V00_06770 [Bacilli bacterium]